MPDPGYSWYGPDLSQEPSALRAVQTPMAGDPLTMGGKPKKDKKGKTDDLFQLLMALTLFGNPFGPQPGSQAPQPTPSPTPTQGPKYGTGEIRGNNTKTEDQYRELMR